MKLRILLSVLVATGASAATLLPGVTASNLNWIAGTPTNVTVSAFSTGSDIGMKISGTVDAVCSTTCDIAFSLALGSTTGASTLWLGYDFTVTGSAATWSMTNGGATTYASGGPALGQFTGSAAIVPGTFAFQATSASPFTITIPNNSIDFTLQAPSAVPEPASAGLAALGTMAAAWWARRRRR